MAKKRPITGKAKINLKPQRSRALIREFHVLLKRKARLEAADPKSLELGEINARIAALGGLESYQQASISGQNTKRGGDSSRVLVEWLRTRHMRAPASLLEVGCLDVRNACSTSKLFSRIERIDLNSQHPLILRQDFMDRPVPNSDDGKFTVVSLSLVLNFVPDAAQRGRMLEHTTKFLFTDGYLFLVLPAPCIYNSRYCSQELLEEILTSMGYTIVEFKKANKIVYWLLQLKRTDAACTRVVKRLINEGPGRNNFCVTI